MVEQKRCLFHGGCRLRAMSRGVILAVSGAEPPALMFPAAPGARLRPGATTRYAEAVGPQPRFSACATVATVQDGLLAALDPRLARLVAPDTSEADA